MNNRGSHVGLVLSFVVFVTFLFFVFTVLNPAVDQQENKKLNLDLVKQNLINNLTSTLSVTSVKIKNATNYTDDYDCLKINDSIGFVDEKARIKDKNNDPVSGDSVGDKIRIYHGGEKFFKIFHSIAFMAGNAKRENCDELTRENYTIGPTRINEYIFRQNILDLLDGYDNDYEGLKNSLGVTGNNEFGIAFVNVSGYEVQKGFVNVSGNIYIEEIPIQYYDTDANINSGSLKIRIW